MKDLKSYGRLTPEERKKIRKFCVFADDFYSGSGALKGGHVYYDQKRKLFFVVTAITSPW